MLKPTSLRIIITFGIVYLHIYSSIATNHITTHSKTAFYSVKNKKYFFTTDYLNNVRSTIIGSKSLTNIGYDTKTLGSSNYYSFGMKIPAIKTHYSKSKYGFNGMEKDNEVKNAANSYNFNARILDPRLGRWLTSDPLEHQFPDQSTYSSMANNPVLHIDPDGKAPEHSAYQAYAKQAWGLFIHGYPEDKVNKQPEGLKIYATVPTHGGGFVGGGAGPVESFLWSDIDFLSLQDLSQQLQETVKNEGRKIAELTIFFHSGPGYFIVHDNEKNKIYIQVKGNIDNIHIIRKKHIEVAAPDGGINEKVKTTNITYQRNDYFMRPLKEIGALMTQDGEIIMRGCEFAKDERGEIMLQTWSKHSGKKVTASSNIQFAPIKMLLGEVKSATPTDNGGSVIYRSHQGVRDFYRQWVTPSDTNND